MSCRIYLRLSRDPFIRTCYDAIYRNDKYKLFPQEEKFFMEQVKYALF